VTEQYVAWCALLAMPDPPDLPPRRIARILPGKADRYRRYFPALAMAYLQHRLEERGPIVDLDFRPASEA